MSTNKDEFVMDMKENEGSGSIQSVEMEWNWIKKSR